MNTQKLRREYRTHDGHLLEQHASPDPFEQFEKWFVDAIHAKIDMIDAMTLATATPDGVPSARDGRPERFRQKKGSVSIPIMKAKKGKGTCREPERRAWFSIGVNLTDRFAAPAPSRKCAPKNQIPISPGVLSAVNSPSKTERQSIVISGREHLMKAFQRAEQKYASEAVPRPPHWGGYRFVPNLFEFWQGCPDRLHDRLCYALQPNGTWKITRAITLNL